MSSKKDKHQKHIIAAKKNLKDNSTFFIEKRSVILLFLCLFAFAFFLYYNTLNHSYVLDDFSIIKENTLTKNGTSSLKEIFSSSYREGYSNNSNNLYRPLSKAMFAIEWQMAPDDPFVNHFMNVFLFALTCGILFIIFLKFIKINPYLLFIAALIFTAHPIHTEVVANIKSRDEILSMLFLLASLLFISKHVVNNKLISLIASLFCFFLALLSKESAIIYVGIVPLVIYFFTDTSLRNNLKITLSTGAVTIIYLFIHQKVIGNIGIENIPVIDNSLLITTDFFQQRATAILIMGKYLLLLLFPHPLSSDYSYNTIPLVTSFANGGFLLALLIHVFLLGFAILKFRQKNFYAFCILFYLISMSIASNIFMLIGTNMAERLLYFPSIAFSLAMAYFLCKIFKINLNESYPRISKMLVANKPLLMALSVILILYSIKTVARNKDWRSDSALFEKDLQTVPNSAHMLFYSANNLSNKDSIKVRNEKDRELHLALAQKQINKALSIYEIFPDGHNVAGRIAYEYKNYDAAYKSYSRALELNSDKAMYHNNIGTCLFSTGKFQEAAKAFQKATELDKYDADARCNLGSAYGALGEAYKQKNDMENAGKMFKMAIDNFEKTIQIDPTYKTAYQFLGFTFMNMGDTVNGQRYIDKASQMK